MLRKRPTKHSCIVDFAIKSVKHIMFETNINKTIGVYDICTLSP